MAANLEHGRTRAKAVAKHLCFVPECSRVARINLPHQVVIICVFFVRINRANRGLVAYCQPARPARNQPGWPTVHKVRQIFELGADGVPVQARVDECLAAVDLTFNPRGRNRDAPVAAAACWTRPEWHAGSPGRRMRKCKESLPCWEPTGSRAAYLLTMSNAQTIEPARRTPLRLWPGVAAAILLLMTRCGNSGTIDGTSVSRSLCRAADMCCAFVAGLAATRSLGDGPRRAIV